MQKTKVAKSNHTEGQIQRASAPAEQWVGTLDSDKFEEIAELRAIEHAADPVGADQAGPREARGFPRRDGRTSNQVPIALVVSGHASKQGFANQTAAGRR